MMVLWKVNNKFCSFYIFYLIFIFVWRTAENDNKTGSSKNYQPQYLAHFNKGISVKEKQNEPLKEVPPASNLGAAAPSQIQQNPTPQTAPAFRPFDDDYEFVSRNLKFIFRFIEQIINYHFVTVKKFILLWIARKNE